MSAQAYGGKAPSWKFISTPPGMELAWFDDFTSDPKKQMRNGKPAYSFWGPGAPKSHASTAFWHPSHVDWDGQSCARIRGSYDPAAHPSRYVTGGFSLGPMQADLPPFCMWVWCVKYEPAPGVNAVLMTYGEGTWLGGGEDDVEERGTTSKEARATLHYEGPNGEHLRPHNGSLIVPAADWHIGATRYSDSVNAGDGVTIRYYTDDAKGGTSKLRMWHELTEGPEHYSNKRRLIAQTEAITADRAKLPKGETQLLIDWYAVFAPA